MASEDTEHKELLTSLVSAIKSYSGSDPLRPWLHGMKKMKAVLPPNSLKEKLPRFLQKCAQTFESDQRYHNDPRYIRVWIDLMDYVEDAKILLKKMEKNQIGLKRASFYIAYALYYEKIRKLEEADKMYHVGIQNLAEPVSDVHKYYEQFLQRLELYKKRKSTKGEGSSKNPIPNPGSKKTKNRSGLNKPELVNRFNSENTIMVRKFVDLAIEEKSRAENVLHLGLVEPTMNTKEAMSDILSMFQKPLDLDPAIERKLKRNGDKKFGNKIESVFEIYVDEENRPQIENAKKMNEGFEIYVDEENKPQNENVNKMKGGFEIYVDEEIRPQNENKNKKEGGFEIYVDEENRPQNENKNKKEGGFEIYVDEENRPQNENKNKKEGGFEIYVDQENRPRNDNTNKKEGGFEIYVDEENKPQNENKNKKEGGFKIYVDDENDSNLKTETKKKMEEMQISKENMEYENVMKGEKAKMENKCPLVQKSKMPIMDDGLFEPTYFTKQALDDINDMFGKPLDF